MKVVLTGSSGRIGRAIFGRLTVGYDVLGIDRTPFATTRIVGDFTDNALLSSALDGAAAVIHTAAVHAPHVGLVSDAEFERINVAGTARLAELARAAGVRRFVMTSTTAMYGLAKIVGSCTWLDETTEPQPVSIYHRTKLAAERVLEGLARDRFSVRILRVSRSFPEGADTMAGYRLHRGIDVRDAADAHVEALVNEGAIFQRYVISGATPFRRSDCDALSVDAPSVIGLRLPALVTAFRERGWTLPQSIDRIYAPNAAERGLGWRSRFGFEEVLAQLDRRSLEVLPVGARLTERSE